MGIGFGKWAAKKVAETITKVKPGTKFKGQSTVEAIKIKSKKFKSKMADEAKKAQKAEKKLSETKTDFVFPPKEKYIGSHIKSKLGDEDASNQSYEEYYKDLI